jgi:soluble lytic murein transglycosylase-like protein
VRFKFVWTRRRSRATLPLALVMLLGHAAPGTAQIYSWRDARGNLVLSNRRPASPARTYPVAGTDSVLATRFVAPERGLAYDQLITEHARLNGVRTDLVRAVVQVESAFNPAAQSPKGALGLMQLMPATIQQFGVSNPFNPAENVRAGVAYLRQLLDRYGNNEELALAAYNAGPSAVDRYGQKVPPYTETRDYVARVNEMAGRPLQFGATRIYRIVETIDGRQVVRYSDRRPPNGSYAVVSGR